jgi:hypothetical protein
MFSVLAGLIVPGLLLELARELMRLTGSFLVIVAEAWMALIAGP